MKANKILVLISWEIVYKSKSNTLRIRLVSAKKNQREELGSLASVTRKISDIPTFLEANVISQS